MGAMDLGVSGTEDAKEVLLRCLGGTTDGPSGVLDLVAIAAAGFGRRGAELGGSSRVF